MACFSAAWRCLWPDWGGLLWADLICSVLATANLTENLGAMVYCSGAAKNMTNDGTACQVQGPGGVAHSAFFLGGGGCVLLAGAAHQSFLESDFLLLLRDHFDGCQSLAVGGCWGKGGGGSVGGPAARAVHSGCLDCLSLSLSLFLADERGRPRGSSAGGFSDPVHSRAAKPGCEAEPSQMYARCRQRLGVGARMAHMAIGWAWTRFC